jgi:hypothetical protein
MSLPPLASPDDIAARLGRELNEAEAIRAPALLTDASAQIRRYCRRDFLLHADETDLFRGHDGEITLPDKTTTLVSAVVAVGGDYGDGLDLPDIAITWFVFDGIDRIRYDLGLDFIINLPWISFESGAYPHTFKVTRTYGYADIPDDVNMVCANAALSVLTAPTLAAGVISEQIGPYSYRLERSGGGVSVALSQGDLAMLKDYRMTTSTVMMRLR